LSAVPTKIRFLTDSSSDPFSVALRTRVDKYFTDRKLSKFCNTEMVVKSLIYFVGFWGIYGVIMSGSVSPIGMLFLAMFLGLLTAGIGFNIGHDAIHGAYSSKKWVNDLMSHSFTTMGADISLWRLLHNVVHHTYTNIPEVDGDLDPVPWLRFDHVRKHKWYHRFQHIYAPLLYTATSLVWVFKKDYQFARRRKHLVHNFPARTLQENLQMIGFKLLYYFAFIGAPLLFLDLPWYQILIGFIAMHMACGLALAVVFQLGHIVEGPSFPTFHDSPAGIQNSWLAHQLDTTADFGATSHVMEWLFGGLNCQVEHHLFPKICHVHYRHLSPIVAATAKEFGLTYHAYPSFWSAMRSHFRLMKQLGRPEFRT